MNIPNIKSNPYPSISNYQNQSSNAQACGFSEVAGLQNAENMDELTYYERLAASHPELSFRLMSDWSETKGAIPYEDGSYHQIHASVNEEGKAECTIGIELDVIRSMQKDPEYAAKVEELLKDAKETTEACRETAEEEARKRSKESEEYDCKVKSVESSVVDRGGEPWLVTEIRFEWVEKENKIKETGLKLWNTSLKDAKQKFMDKIAEKLENDLADLFMERDS